MAERSFSHQYCTKFSFDIMIVFVVLIDFISTFSSNYNSLDLANLHIVIDK